ncbi:putative Ig domain-containing protein [Undibacterium sp. Ji22W]|uniref:putative Ig domain-containing protein n=1 Tax=Undibacterium sp. Ji22W TaxID=3413038 RepID=UPI003BEFF676
MTKQRSVGTSQNAVISEVILQEDLNDSVVNDDRGASLESDLISIMTTGVEMLKLASSERLAAQFVDTVSWNVANMTGTESFNHGALSGAPVKSGLVGSTADTAPVITNAAFTAYYMENSPGTILAPELQVSDADDTTLISVTVRISSGALTGDLLSAITAGTNITSTYDSVNATLQLTGIDSLAHYQQVLRSVTYSSNSENPTNFNLNTTRTLTWQLNSNVEGFSGRADVVTGGFPRSVALSDFNGDGNLDMVVANESSKSVSILLGNGNGGFGTKTDFAVGDGPGFVCVGDVNGDGKPDVVVANYTSNNVSVMLGDGAGGLASKTNFSTGNGPRAIALGDFNGDGKLDIVATNYESTTVAVLLGNGAGSFGTKTTYTVGNYPSAIAVADFNGDGRDDIAAVNYSDYGNVAILLASNTGGFATKTSFKTGFGAAGVAKGDFNGDGKLDLAVTNYQDKSVSILLGDGAGSFGPKADFRVGNYVGSPAVGDFNRDGKLDLAVGNEASNQVSVLFGSGAGSFGGRTDLVMVGSPSSVAVGDLNGDGRLDIAAASYNASKASVLLNSTSLPSAIHQTTIVVTAANDASLITGVDVGTVIEAGGATNSQPGVPIASGNLTCSDIDNSPNTFQVVSAGNVSAEEHGTFTMTAGGDWSYSLNNNDAAVQALRVGSALTDHITVASLDGTQKVVTITIKGSNDAPIVYSPLADVIHAQNTQLDLPIGSNTFFDPDLGDALTYQVTLANGAALPDWLTFNASTMTLSGTPANGDVGSKDIQITVSDTEGASVSEVFTLRIINVNDSPMVTLPLSDVSVTEHQVFNFVVPANTFSEVDVGDVLTYHASLPNGDPLPAWLNFDSATRTFRGTPGNAEIGTLDIMVFVTDTENGYASDTFRITFNSVNDSPLAVGALPNASVTEDSAFQYAVPANSFSDADIGDVLSYSASLANGNPLPAWLSFNPIEHTFYGIPGNESVGVTDIRVIATDTSGAAVSSVFALRVNNLNDFPELVTPLVDVAANEDVAFNFVLPANAFADVDVGDRLTYSAQMANGSPLPAWISFNPTTLTFTGTASNSEVGEVAIQVTVSDQSGASTSDIFSMVVNNVNDAPIVSSALHDIILDQNNNFSLVVPSSTFIDEDLGDVLSYSAKLVNGNNLPTWLHFYSNTNTFSGTPGNEAVGTNIIQVTAIDKEGASVTSVFNLSVLNVNDAPTLNRPLADVSATERESLSVVIPPNTFSDVDVVDVLTFNAMLSNGDPLPAWLRFDASTKSFNGTPNNDDVGTIDVLVFVTDTANTHASDIFRITVNNINDAPTVAIAIADAVVNEDANFSYIVSSNAYSDVDVGDTLTYSAQLANGNVLPAWLSFNPTNKTFSGTPGNNEVGSLDVKVIATDIAGSSVADIFNIRVNNTNDVPTLIIPLGDAIATEDASFIYVVPSNTYNDVDAGDVLTYNAQLANGNALPTWLNFNPTTKTFSGTPGNNEVGKLDVKVIATDIAGSSVSDIFGIKINNTNDTPILVSPLSDVIATEDASFTYSVPSNAYADIDAGDTLTYSAQLANGNALPTWLSFIPATRTFSGTAGNNEVGRYDVKVTATDFAGSSVSDIFSIQVNNTNDAPSLAIPVPDQIANVGGLFNYAIPANTFLDVDAGDALTYSATLSDGKPLPAWLNFNATTGTLSGTPLSSDAGSLSVKIKAADKAGAIATDSFAVTVLFSVINGSSGIDNLLGSNADDQINGLAGNDKLSGLDGNDTLNGGAGVDEMRGGKGDDIYIVDNISDVIIENVNEGADSIQTTVTYTMPANVEKLILMDTAAINANGNSADNILIGNSGVNTLTGGAGNDFLDGAAGSDKLYGGTGNDTYVIDNIGDLISENTGEGLDVVNSSISYTLTNNVEVLLLTGSLTTNGTGNASQNLLIGNSANNVLNGGTSNDLMQGAAGDDTLTDTSGNNLFDGGLGNDVLTGGTGKDLFIGGRGNDTINTSSGADVIVFNRGDGKDIINASTGKDNTISLGHGIKYADLFFMKSVNDLILQTGTGEQVTLKDWYLSINNHSVAKLQIVIEGTSDYVSTSNNVLNNHKIELFNFDGLVTAFDQARAATPGMSSWALSNSLLNFYTSGSDTSAIGGDLTYQYAMNGNLSNIAMNPALVLLTGTAFGVNGQNLQLTSALIDGSPILV